MGKKGVLLDNGKNAQTSMALYWKNNHEKAKHQKQKHQEDNAKEITDKSVMSNFQKWKIHKQKLISKAYTKPTKLDQINQKNQEKQKEQEDLIERLMQNKKPKIVTIPGFRSKTDLASKLQIQKPQQADQSKNILNLPTHLSGLTQQQIVQMLRQRKRKLYLQKKIEKDQTIKDQTNMLFDVDYLEVVKKQQDKAIAIAEQQKQLPSNYFKSDILNRIQKEGIKVVMAQKEKIDQNISRQTNAATSMTINQPAKKWPIEKQLADKQPLTKEHLTNELRFQSAPVQKHLTLNPKFLPRVLKK